MSFGMEHPWVLPLIVVVFVLMWRVTPASGRWAQSGWLRVIGVSFGLLAIGAPVVPGGDTVRRIVVLVDRSSSFAADMPRAFGQSLEAVTGAMRPGDQLGTVVFGADALVDQRVSADFDTSAASAASAAIDPGATDLAAAIELGRTLVVGSPDARLLLVSDGAQTRGDAGAAAYRAAADGIPIDVWLPDAGAVDGLGPRVVEVRAPSLVRVNEPFTIELVVRGRAGTRVPIDGIRNGLEAERFEGALTTDGDNVFRLSRTVGSGGFHHWAFRSGDQINGVSMVATGPVRMALVSDDARRGVMESYLGVSGVRVDWIAPTAIPSTADVYRSFDAVVLDQIEASRLSPASMVALREYVVGGGGLLMTGGAGSFGPGGYVDTPIAETLPVDLRIRDRSRIPRLGFVLVLDKSGSMAASEGGLSKIGVARDAALSVVDLLDPDDWIGVVAFDVEALEVLPLGPVVESGPLESRLRTLSAGGDTAMFPAVDMAFRWLEDAVEAERKHVLLLSDGESDAADVSRLLDRVTGSPITLSVVGIGDEIDREFLSGVAERGRGAAYFPESIRLLPEVFNREAVRISSDWIIEESSVWSGSDHGILAGVDLAAAPSIDGHIATAMRNGGAAVARSTSGDPLIAVGGFGLGRSGVITTDLGSEWTTRFRTWPGAGMLVANTMGWVARGVPDPYLRADMTWDGDLGAIALDVIGPDGTFRNGLSVEAVLRSPMDEVLPVLLEQTAPGRYSAAGMPNLSGPWEVVFLAHDPETGEEMRGQMAVYNNGGAEGRRSADPAELERIAEISGGRILGPGGPRFNPERIAAARVGLRGVLVFFMLVTFLADLAVRTGAVPARFIASRTPRRQVRA